MSELEDSREKNKKLNPSQRKTSNAEAEEKYITAVYTISLLSIVQLTLYALTEIFLESGLGK